MMEDSMAKCETFEQQLYEDQVSPELSQHLQECSSCYRLSEKLHYLDRGLKFEIAVDSRIADFRRKLISQRVASERSAPIPSFRSGLWRVARIAAVIAFAALLFV